MGGFFSALSVGEPFCGERGALKSYSNPQFAKPLEIIGLNLLIVSYLYIFLFVTYLQYLSHFWVVFGSLFLILVQLFATRYHLKINALYACVLI